MLLRKRILASAVGTMLAAGLTYGGDATAEYDTVNNPAAVGNWSYGEFQTTFAIPAGPTTLFPANTTGAPWPATVHAWHQPFATPLESAFVSKELAGALTGIGSTEWDPGQIVMRPGVNDQAPFIRFTAPAAGTYTYTCTYAAADLAGGTRRVLTIVNGVVTHADPLIGAKGSVTPVTHSNGAGVVLGAGDTIEFVATAGGTPGDYTMDAVQFRNVQVNQIAVPTPKFPCFWRQPWTRPLASHPSVVRTCQGDNVQFAPTCLDDFVCKEDSNIRRISWWGVNPSSPGVPQRNFLIRFWLDNQQCFPEQPLYEECVRAKVRRAGADCTNQRVFRFFTSLSNPFPVVAGQRYWIEIAEVDADMDPNAPNGISSPNPGAVDFAWSSHRPIRDCRAIERNMLTGFFNSPLIDACDNEPEDLAFTLSSRRIIISVPVFPIKPVFRLELRDPNTKELVEELCVEADSSGEIVCEPESPEGQYLLILYGMASPGEDLGVHPLPADGDLNLGQVPVRLGDADNSGRVAFPDITRVLNEWLQTGPYPLP